MYFKLYCYVGMFFIFGNINVVLEKSVSKHCAHGMHGDDPSSYCHLDVPAVCYFVRVRSRHCPGRVLDIFDNNTLTTIHGVNHL